MFPIVKSKCRVRAGEWEVSVLIRCPEDGLMWIPFRRFGDDVVKARACLKLVNGLDDPLLKYVECDDAIVLPLVVDGGDL